MSLLRSLRAFLIRLSAIFPGRQSDTAFSEEMRSNLQLHIDDLMRSGMTEKQARREAALRFGGIEQTHQRYRERQTLPAFDNLLQDLRFALRQLRRTPGFSIIATIMLASGIGSSVAIFAFVDAALIKPLPYHDPATLAGVTESVKLMGPANLSYPDYLDWKQRNHSFRSLDIFTNSGRLLNLPSGTVPVSILRVSDGFFRTLGIAPMLGRDFYPGEDLPSAGNTVILSYDSWQKWFQGRADIIGQKITLSGIPQTIIGVMPETFDFAPGGSAEFWLPFHAVKGSCDLNRSCHSLYGIARLKDGITFAAALADMKDVAAELEREYPGSNRGQGAFVQPLSEDIVGDVRPILLTLLAGAMLLFIIACVNVASLLLVRSESRRKEIAVRGALGASRGRLLMQFFIESVTLVTIGAGLGICLAAVMMHLLSHLIPKFMLSRMPYLIGLSLNPHVLLFAAGITLAALILFAVTPLLRLPIGSLRDSLAESSRGSGTLFWRRIGANMIVIELAIAVVLLVGAGLLCKSFYRLLHVDLKYQPDHLAMVSVMVPESLYPKDDDLTRLQHQILTHVTALPGVESAALFSLPPSSYNGNTDWIRFVGRPYNGEHNEVNLREITTDAMKTLQAKLLSGRFFTETDDAAHPKVVIINQALARQYYPGQDPIGQRIGDDGLSPGSIKEIVGVVDDIKEGSLDSSIWPAVYYPLYQSQEHYFTLMVRTHPSEDAILPTLVSTINHLDPGIGTADPISMNRRIHESPTAYLHRSSAWLIGSFATLALLLGVIGIYGVIAYSVSQRTREIGIRMALGAQRNTVCQLILREAGTLAIIGITFGLASAVGAAILMRKLLFATAAWDATTLVAAALLLGASAMLASWFPALRAARVNPVEALRTE
jgi:macrolide transport system ATP-binding/permease protein